MNLETWFSVANTTALISWIILAIFPNSRATRLLIHSGGVSFFLSFMYLTFASNAMLSEAPGGFGSLAAVKQLFESDVWLLAGWIHYLAFDLLIGSWIVKDASQRKIHHLIRLPFMFLTFMLGPIGFLGYLLLRNIKGKKLESLF